MSKPDSTPQLQGISQIALPDSVKQSMGQKCHPVHHRYHCCLLGCHCCCQSPQGHWLGQQRHHQQHGQEKKPEWGFGSSGQREKMIIPDVEDFLDGRFVLRLTSDKILEIYVEISFIVNFC